MNGIAQAVLGAALGELMLGRHLGRAAPIWGALLGVLPELPGFLLMPFLNTAQELAWNQGISHSLPLMILLGWGVTKALKRLWKQEKITQQQIAWWVAVFWSVHLLVDGFTAEGIPVLWPLSGQRLALHLMSSCDGLFIAPLFITGVWLAFLREEFPKKKSRKKKANPSLMPKRRKLCLWGLGLATGYAVLCTGVKILSNKLFDADLARRGIHDSRKIEGPVAGNVLLRRAVVDRNGEFLVGYRSVFEFQEKPIRWTIYQKQEEMLQNVDDLWETKTLRTLTDGWWIARRDAKGAWLGDLRDPEERVWGSKKTMVDSRLARSWLILPDEKKDRLREIWPGAENTAEYFKRMITRTAGNSDSWEANPRLAGVPGSLPEFLAVEE